MNKKQNIYLIAKYFARPKNKHQSSVKGNMQIDSNIQWDEQVNIARRLKTTDITTAKIILNITNQTVEADWFSSGKGFNELFEYFYKNSPAEISRQLQMVGVTVEKQEPDYEHLSENVSEEPGKNEGPITSAQAESSIS